MIFCSGEFLFHFCCFIHMYLDCDCSTLPSVIFIYREGEEWAALRKPAQEKMLRPANVASYVPLISRVTNDFVEVLRKKGKIDDLQKELMNYSTESKTKCRKILFTIKYHQCRHTIYIFVHDRG